jgi:hypothetical protein
LRSIMTARWVLPLLVLVPASGACARQDDTRGGITTIRSGSPEGVRVTSVSPDDRAGRLAVELCRRGESCGRVGKPEQRWPTENACVSEVQRDLPRRLGAWTCPAFETRSRFEECLAAIRSARCDAPIDERWSELTACRAEVVCASP